MTAPAWPERSSDIRMEGGDLDVPHKRPRLDSVNPPYSNGLPPHQAQPSRPPTQASPPPVRHYPPHTLPPPPAQPYPPAGSGHFPGPTHSQSLPPSDIRAYSDPRNIPSPSQRTHGVTVPPVTLPARSITQDSISTYSRPAQSSASDPHSSRSESNDAKPPGMEHGQGQWPANPDHRPNGHHPLNGLPPNGLPPNGLPPNGYQVVSPSHDQFQTPPLPTGASQYGQPQPPYTPTAPYIGPPIQYSSQQAQTQAQQQAQAQAHAQAQQRRKQVRATQACNHCRSRKQKCDEARPCQFCRENNFDCQYKDVPPPKQDRTMMQLQDTMNNLADNVKTFMESVNSWQTSVTSWQRSVESRLPPSGRHDNFMGSSNHASPEQMYGSRMPTPVQGRAQLRRVSSMKTESPILPQTHISPIPTQVSTPIKQEGPMGSLNPPATPADSVRTDRTNVSTTSKEKTGLQSDHTTPAHRLMETWPSMQGFATGVPEIQRLLELGHRVSDYPMQLEQARGLIRVWGKGEGHDLNDGAQGPGSPESSDESSDVPSPEAAKEGLWGPVQEPSTPSTVSGDIPRDGNVGGLTADGHLKIDQQTCIKLHQLYHDNIHSLHPFLNPSKLRKMIRDFSDTYSPSSAVPGHVYAGIKRKRSATGFVDPYSPARGATSPEFIERSLRNAIVLLVLALGKVCEYEKPLPAPQRDRLFGPSSVYNKGSPHSVNASFGSMTSEDGLDTRPRNIDVLPGMGYFCYATDILGNQQGGNTVAHAQAMLLAALYMGQYARVLESWSWINNACRVCLILIKADEDKIHRKNYLNPAHPPPQYPPKENYRLNLVKCVYWTCLQLETDILAEMSSLPPSEISKHQEDVSYPSGVFEKFPDSVSFDENSDHERTMWIYSSQIHLRVILNEAHNSLYGSADGKRNPGFDQHNLKEVANQARVHADILLTWRRLLPAALCWNNDDPPSTDVNIARLRAKFYGGHYMILRPFLFMAVHEIELPPGAPTSGSYSQHSSPAATGESASTPGYMHPQRGLMDLTSEQKGVLTVAHQCIESAIQSTIAFDRVGADPNSTYRLYHDTAPKRLILTNIFGTLHAQFGNMLVLAAVFRSRVRNHLPTDTKLNQATLAALYNRTIKVLADIAPNSPVLTVDMEILQNVQKMLNLEQSTV